MELGASVTGMPPCGLVCDEWGGAVLLVGDCLNHCFSCTATLLRTCPSTVTIIVTVTVTVLPSAETTSRRLTVRLPFTQAPSSYIRSSTRVRNWPEPKSGPRPASCGGVIATSSAAPWERQWPEEQRPNDGEHGRIDAVPTEKSIWHPQRELNGVDHRLALSRGTTGGITPTRSIAVGVDLTEHAKAVRQLAH